jgi:hypothetical protein
MACVVSVRLVRFNVQDPEIMSYSYFFITHFDSLNGSVTPNFVDESDLIITPYVRYE